MFEEAYGRASQIQGWFSRADFEKLHELLTATIDGCVLEVGSFLGRSTAFISHYHPVICIDPWRLGPKWAEALKKRGVEVDARGSSFYSAFERFAMTENPFGSRVVAIRKCDYDVWPAWGGRIGLMHLDHLHTENAVFNSLRAWRRHLSPGAKVYVHDSNVPDVMKGIKRSGIEILEVVAASEFQPAVCAFTT